MDKRSRPATIKATPARVRSDPRFFLEEVRATLVFDEIKTLQSYSTMSVL